MFIKKVLMNIHAIPFKAFLIAFATLHSCHAYSSEVKHPSDFIRPKKHELIVANNTPFSLQLQSETSCRAEHFRPRETRKITPTSKGSDFTFSLFNKTFMNQPYFISFATSYKHLTITHDIHSFDIFIGKRPEEFLTQILFEDV